MTTNLPQGWACATVGDLAEYINGLAFKPTDWEKTGRQIIRIQNLTDPAASYNRTSKEYDPRFVVCPDDILVSWSATLDAFRWTGPEAILNQHIFKVVPRQQVADKDFLFWGLKLVIREMWESEHTHGSTMKHINRGPFLAHRFLLPPLPEQRRIVAKLNRLFARSTQVESSLQNAPRLLDRLRKATLAAAFRGDLTADWRAKHPDVEPADKLLERIRAERRRRWEEAELAKLTAKGKPPTDDRWKDKYTEPEPVSLTEREPLPEGWCWASADEVFTDTKIGLVRSTSEQGSDGVPYVRMQHFDEQGLWHLEDVSRVSVTEQELRDFALHPGDILFNTRNSAELVGKVALWQGSDDTHVFNNNLMRIRVIGALPEWVAWQMVSPVFRARIADFVSATTGVAAIYGRDLFRQTLCIPPIAEQEVIVKRLRSQLGRIQTLTRLQSEAETAVLTLERAILAKAFRGELVPQDPNDEPASVLLERLRADATTEPTRKTARRGRKPDAEPAPDEPSPPTAATPADAKPAPRSRRSAPDKDAPVATTSPEPPAPASRVPPDNDPPPRAAEQAALAFPADATPFLDLPADAQAELVHAILLGEGPLAREDAIRRAAEILRDQGRAQFQRLRSDGPLATAIDHAISLAVRLGRIDRPERGSVRAVARTPADIPPPLWHRAIQAAHQTTPGADPDTLVRTAATWLQTQVGLEFQRLRTGGHIDTALRQALAAASRRS